MIIQQSITTKDYNLNSENFIVIKRELYEDFCVWQLKIQSKLWKTTEIFNN